MSDNPGAVGGDERQARALEIAKRFDEGRIAVSGALGELMSAGLVPPRALIDTIGFDDLVRFLPPGACARVLEAAIAAGRHGGAFDDLALLEVVTPDAISRALPLAVLSDVLVALTSRIEPPPEVLGDEDLAPPSLSSGRVSLDDEPMEVDPESGSVELR